MSDDEAFMRRALELAVRGRGWVEPNPMVGAVVVHKGIVVGEGFHERFGAPHAEVNALEQAGERARGATLYVSLEPCCHHGKTPPCVDAIVRAGISRVMAAMLDPFEKVAGQGIERLRSAGLAVEIGLCEAAARAINAPFVKRTTTGVPYVHAKWAMTLDGKIATASGESKWITGTSARQIAHELRGRMDAIIVGIGTVLADDPLLTARPPGPRVAVRIVLDSAGRLPLDSHLARTACDLPVFVATSEQASGAALAPLRERGCEILPLPTSERGVSVPALLQELGRRGMTNVMVEGGSRVLGAFHDADAIDEIHVFVAARVLGGAKALSPVAGRGVLHVGEATAFELIEIQSLGDDCLVHARRRV